MKAITLTQPWASLVASGSKRIETRSWRTNYRGPLAIHAAKGWTEADRTLCVCEPFYRHLRAHLGPDANVIHDLPRGAIVAVVDLASVHGTGSLIVDDWLARSNDERAFGDYSPGRFAWLLNYPIFLPTEPIPFKGRLGLWQVPTWLEDDLRAVRSPA